MAAEETDLGSLFGPDGKRVHWQEASTRFTSQRSWTVIVPYFFLYSQMFCWCEFWVSLLSWSPRYKVALVQSNLPPDSKLCIFESEFFNFIVVCIDKQWNSVASYYKVEFLVLKLWSGGFETVRNYTLGLKRSGFWNNTGDFIRFRENQTPQLLFSITDLH